MLKKKAFNSTLNTNVSVEPTVTKYYGLAGKDMTIFSDETRGGFIDRPLEDKKGYIYIWPEVHDANAWDLFPGHSDTFPVDCKTDIDHIKQHGHCVRKSLDKKFSISIIPKRYFTTRSNPTMYQKYVGIPDGYNEYSQFSGDYNLSYKQDVDNYGPYKDAPGIKVANKSFWTTNFETHYPCFRYVTCYARVS